jgi:hypothetical protein
VSQNGLFLGWMKLVFIGETCAIFTKKRIFIVFCNFFETFVKIALKSYRRPFVSQKGLFSPWMRCTSAVERTRHIPPYVCVVWAPPLRSTSAVEGELHIQKSAKSRFLVKIYKIGFCKYYKETTLEKKRKN